MRKVPSPDRDRVSDQLSSGEKLEAVQEDAEALDIEFTGAAPPQSWTERAAHIDASIARIIVKSPE